MGLAGAGRGMAGAWLEHGWDRCPWLEKRIWAGQVWGSMDLSGSGKVRSLDPQMLPLEPFFSTLPFLGRRWGWGAFSFNQGSRAQGRDESDPWLWGQACPWARTTDRLGS